MGSLDLDTRLSGGDGIYQATLSPDWQIWGVVSQRSARTAKSLRVTLAQNERALLEAQVWSAAAPPSTDMKRAPSVS